VLGGVEGTFAGRVVDGDVGEEEASEVDGDQHEQEKDWSDQGELDECLAASALLGRVRSRRSWPRVMAGLLRLAPRPPRVLCCHLRDSVPAVTRALCAGPAIPLLPAGQ
jgi:hypothetical protein